VGDWTIKLTEESVDKSAAFKLEKTNKILEKQKDD